jgi:SAM-dependent methyltransferase
VHPATYERKLAEEIEKFSAFEVVDDLPPIFHYYSRTHLRPELRALGYDDVRDFFATNIARLAPTRPCVRVVSYGAGNAELEVPVAATLRERGVENFTIECVDIAREMLDRGRRAARERGVAGHLSFVQGDVAHRGAVRTVYDVHIAHQCLHHFVALEALFDAIAAQLADDGVFLVSDMIGRNGHLRWPETRQVIDRLWSRLPARYRRDPHQGRIDEMYQEVDWTYRGFEGIRAQDVLPLLAERFDFREMVGFGGIIDPFVERTYGFNFDPQSPEDRRFIDHVVAIERDLATRGIVKPTQLIALLEKPAGDRASIDVTPYLRLADPPALPDLDTIHFEFRALTRLLEHDIGGDADAPLLASGFFPWEPGSRTLWTARTFTVQLPLPTEARRRAYQLDLACYLPDGLTDTDAAVSIDGAAGPRIAAAYARVRSHPDGILSIPFEAHGGPVTVTVAFDRPSNDPDGPDRRELGVVLRRLVVYGDDAGQDRGAGDQTATVPSLAR